MAGRNKRRGASSVPRMGEAGALRQSDSGGKGICDMGGRDDPKMGRRAGTSGAISGMGRSANAEAWPWP